MEAERHNSNSVGLQLLKERLSRIQTEEGRLKGLRFKPRPSDVFVVTPPKCGTTWMQQIVHQLRTGGDMEFGGINEVVPFIEIAHDTHVDLEAEQKGSPRCYKTHYWYDDCPKGAKYIVIYRDPCAAFYSNFNYLQGWFFQPGEVTIEELATGFDHTSGKAKNEMVNVPYNEHLLSWWKHRNDPNVLFLFFEEMKQDLESVVKVVASFIGINDEEKIRKAVQMSSFEFMKASGAKFDENLLFLYRNKACGLPEDARGNKIASGSNSTALRVLPEKVKETIHKKWREMVTATIGFQTYDELRIAFRKKKPLEH